MKALLTFTLSLWLALSVAANPLILLSGSPPAAGGGAPTPEILHWTLNEGSGTAITAAVGANGDTTVTSWITGKSGSGFALDFDGSTVGAASTSNVDYGGATEVTAAMWVYPDDASPLQILLESSANVGGGRAFLLYFSSSTLTTQVSDSASGSNIRTCAMPATGAWVHIAATFNFTTGAIAVYYDGASQTLTPTLNTFAASTTIANDVLYVGARTASNFFLNGRMDDVRIYSGNKSANLAAIIADPQ